MKKTVSAASAALFFVILFSALTYSQTLEFCEGVKDNGEPIVSSSTFYIPEGGGYFYFLVHLPEAVGCDYVTYEIYMKGRDGSETFIFQVEQDGMSPSWTWFWKQVTFYIDGQYKVYVVDCNRKRIASAPLTVKYSE